MRVLYAGRPHLCPNVKGIIARVRRRDRVLLCLHTRQTETGWEVHFPEVASVVSGIRTSLEEEIEHFRLLESFSFAKGAGEVQHTIANISGPERDDVLLGSHCVVANLTPLMANAPHSWRVGVTNNQICLQTTPFTIGKDANKECERFQLNDLKSPIYGCSIPSLNILKVLQFIAVKIYPSPLYSGLYPFLTIFKSIKCLANYNWS